MNDKYEIIQQMMIFPRVFDGLHLQLQKDPASRTAGSLSTWLFCGTSHFEDIWAFQRSIY